MLIEGLYTIHDIRGNESKLSAKVDINENAEILEGHFPNKPVVPGVIQIQIVKEILSQHYKRKVNILTINSTKFLSVWDPRTCPSIEIDMELIKSEDGIKTKAIGYDENNKYFKLSALFL